MLTRALVCFLQVVFIGFRWLLFAYDIVFAVDLPMKKIPRHLAIGVKQPKVVSPEQIANLVEIVRRFGIPELTVYNTCSFKVALHDLSGRVGPNVFIVCENQSAYIDKNGACTHVDRFDVSDQLILRLIPADYEERSGLKDFMVANPEPNQSIRESWRLQINGLPDLVLICDGAVAFCSISLFGFPSWLLRTAELGSLPDVAIVRYQHIQQQLLQYAKSTQRCGH